MRRFDEFRPLDLVMAAEVPSPDDARRDAFPSSRQQMVFFSFLTFFHQVCRDLDRPRLKIIRSTRADFSVTFPRCFILSVANVSRCSTR